MALIMVVLMTAYISEFNYTARARILSAAHARDDLKSLYLANSGVRIYTLLLAFGNQIGGNQFIRGMFENFGLPPIDGATMICKDLPSFDTGFLRFLVGAEGMTSDQKEEGLMEMVGLGGGESDVDVPQRGEVNSLGSNTKPSLRRGLLDFEGDVKVHCSDETAKLDLNGLAEPSFFTLPLQQHPVAMMLFGQFSPEEYDPLFEERLKIDRWELIANIKDYIDETPSARARSAGMKVAPTTTSSPGTSPRTSCSTPCRRCAWSPASPTRCSARSARAGPYTTAATR